MLRTMLRYFYFILILSFVRHLCLFAEVPVDQLVSGANRNRSQIKSGELRIRIFQDFPESPENIQKQIQENIQAHDEDLRKLRAEGENIEWFLEALRREVTDNLNFDDQLSVAFKIFDDDPARLPEVYQFKLTQMDRKERADRYNEAKHIRMSGYYRVNVYDGKIEVYQSLDAPATEAVSLSTTRKYAVFSDFYFYGRPKYRVPRDGKIVGSETIDGANCYLLEYRVEGKKTPAKMSIRVWIDPHKQFCIRKEYIQQTYEDGRRVAIWERVYEDFAQYEGVWYPLTTREIHKMDGKTMHIDTVIIKDAQFNLDFPANFFHVNPQSYSRRNSGSIPRPEIPTPDSKSSSQEGLAKLGRNKSQTEDELLLSCGPRSLLRICGLLRVNTNFDELAQLSRFHPAQGTNLLGLRDAAEYKGLNPKGIRANLNLLKKNKVPMPAIAFVKGNHFLVIEEVVSDGVQISDPANKYDHHLSFKSLSEIWDGELLIFDYHPQRSEAVPVPIVLVESGYYDFGEKPGGSEIRHTFKLNNIGQQSLKIKKVEKSCACTAAIASSDEIAPGKFGTIDAVLKVPAENRQMEESISVYTNDPIQNKVTLILKGIAFVPISTFPHRLLVGNIHLGTSVTKSFTIHRKKDTRIVGVRTDSNYLVAKIVSKRETPIVRVEVTLLDGMPVGQFTNNILVDYRFADKEITHDVLVFGEILGAFTVSPRHIFFGLVKDEQSVSKTVTISSVSKQPFKITSVQSSSEYVTTKVRSPAHGVGYHLTATVYPKAPTGELSSEILVKTDNPSQPTIRVPFSAIVSRGK